MITIAVLWLVIGCANAYVLGRHLKQKFPTSLWAGNLWLIDLFFFTFITLCGPFGIPATATALMND